MSKLTNNLFGWLGFLALITFVATGLWLAGRPVKAPLQGQFETDTINITAKISGRIESQAVREGDAVKQGALLVTLDSPELKAKQTQAEAGSSAAQAKLSLVNAGARAEDVQAAKAQWTRAAAATELAEKTYRRLHALFAENLISQQRNDEAETNWHVAQSAEQAARAQYEVALHGARSQEKEAADAIARQAAGVVAEVSAATTDTHLVAPLAGEVDKIILHPGELAPAGFPIMTLIDARNLWATFNIREDDFAGIRLGATLKGTVPALGNRPLTLKIDYISPKGDFAIWRPTRLSSGYDVRTFEVRARPSETVEGLRPGMSILVSRD